MGLGCVEWELRTMYCMWYSGVARGGCKKFEVFENMRSSQFAQAWGGKGEQKGRRGGGRGTLAWGLCNVTRHFSEH